VDFQVSCAPEVRADFDDAVALLHHMMYEESRSAFESIAAKDPECPMAHWGIAMTLFQPLWPSRPGPDAIARGHREVELAEELGPATDRERALVSAAAAFYRDPGTADWWARIGRWAEAMEAAWRARPDDIETAAFYALSHLASGYVAANRMAHQSGAAEVLAAILERSPSHPGAVHYTIHANDVIGRAGESPEVVRDYGDIAPAVPHALHMPTHIYVRLGEWPEVVAWNRKSADAARRISPGSAGPGTHYFHALDYMLYAHLQRGDDAAAEAVLEEARAVTYLVDDFATAFHLAAMAARSVVEREAWAESSGLEVRPGASLSWDRYPWAESLTWFARGLGAARTGDREGAQAAEARMALLRDAAEAAGERDFASYIEIDRRILAGWITRAEGRDESAIELLRSAAELEARVQKHPVSPGALYPPGEALGDLLLDLGRPGEALAEYEASLELWPRRYRALLGAARAARDAGQDARSAAHYAALLEVASGGTRPGVAEARGALAEGG
jgi:tetratricopeptide (TPR) repeat protein